MWLLTKRYVENQGISFGKLRPRNCTEDTCPLYCAAKDLYLGTKHININDIAYNKLINVMAIRKLGLGAIRYTPWLNRQKRRNSFS